MPADRAALRAMSCVVTGGLGFIGSNLVHALVDAGATVRVIDALVPSHGGDVRNLDGLDLEVLVATIDDPAVADVVDGADIVFNVAGQVSHTASMRDPLADLRLNAVSHLSFLETLRRVNPTARVVHTSTRQVYGQPLRNPVDEEHPTRPVDVNGVAKLAGEQLHMVYAQAYAMRCTSLRLTNVYGPRQRLTSDELGFLPVFIRTALTDGELQLFGDGSQRRDCLYVDDVVDALLAATDERLVGKVLNVGHGKDHSLAEIADRVVAAAGAGRVTMVPWPEEHRHIAIGSFHTDGTLIAASVGWSATTDLDLGLQHTIAFYRKHPWYLSST
jgi:nucleoside-diphosphate-sugar epimerase